MICVAFTSVLLLLPFFFFFIKLSRLFFPSSLPQLSLVLTSELWH